MRRFRHRIKAVAAVLLSACLVFPPGVMNAWAEEPEYPAAAVETSIVTEAADAAAAEVVPEAVPEMAEEFFVQAETASASDASAATASDALFDEDGFLIDGEVIDDVDEATDSDAELEIIAPEMKTEVIGKKNAGPEWLEDYEYDLSYYKRTVTLNEYFGSEVDVYVPGSAAIDGITYQVVLGPRTPTGGSIWAGGEIQSIEFDSGVGLPENMRNMFSGCESLMAVNLSRLDTSKATSMEKMFENCFSLSYLDLSTFMTENVTDMSGMFRNCASLTHLDLSGFRTPEVTDMFGMFAGCFQLKSIGFGQNFDTSSVTNMDIMFAECNSLKKLDLSSFDLSSLENASSMFVSCDNLEYLNIPKRCSVDIELPHEMQDLSGEMYTEVPKSYFYSFPIARPDKYVFVTSVTMNTDHRTLTKESKFQLKAWPQPVNATNRNVEWSSLDEDIATVSSDGLVTALKEGYTRIDAKTADGIVGRCYLTVGIPVTGIKINTTAKSMKAGEKFRMAAWPQPVNASNKTVLWSSSDPKVAAIDKEGLVTAISGGVTTITAKSQDHGYTKTCKITVSVPVTGLKINTTARTIEAGKNFQMAAWPQPSNATNKAVTWTSSNTAVATVSSTGLVKGIKNGTANITVQTVDGGYKATCKITVGVPVTSLVINSTARTILAGKNFQLAAWPQPANASNRSVTWTSSNPAVATVSSSGLVKGIKDGTAVITVKTVDGGYTKTCTITVGIPVTGIVINTKAKTMNVGKTFQLAAWPQPANASNKAVTWTSSNTSVATVSATGMVTAKKKGTAMITVKTVDAGYSETCTITAQ